MKTVKFKVFIYVLFFGFLASCSNDDNPKQFSLHQPSSIDLEDYDVYTAVISYNHASNFVLKQKTVFGISFVDSNDNYISSLSEGNPGFEPEMVTTLINNNVNPLFLDYNFPISSTQVTLVSEEQLDYIFDDNSYDNNWKQFYNTFKNANGYYMFSAVAFNEDKTKALLETGNLCGSLCGLGTLYYLEKENGLWIIKKTVDTWIS